MIREPNRLPTAATPIPAIAAMTATVSAVVARKVRLAAMTSAVAATIPTSVMTIRMLFRRLAAACAQNVRPFARRVPTEAIANVTMGRTMTTTARSHGRRSSPCPSAIERQTARPRLAIPTTTPADRTIAIANATAAPIRAIQSGRPAVSSVAVVMPSPTRATATATSTASTTISIGAIDIGRARIAAMTEARITVQARAVPARARRKTSGRGSIVTAAARLTMATDISTRNR